MSSPAFSDDFENSLQSDSDDFRQNVFLLELLLRADVVIFRVVDVFPSRRRLQLKQRSLAATVFETRGSDGGENGERRWIARNAHLSQGRVKFGQRVDLEQNLVLISIIASNY